jgi:hypothetical protein
MVHHGDDVCGGVVLVVDQILVVFPPYKSYGAGVLIPAQTLIGVKLFLNVTFIVR